MLKGFTDNGELKDVIITEDGAIKVAMQGGGGEAQQSVITNTSENPVPVNIQNQSVIVGNTVQSPIPVNVTNTEEIETTLNASVQTLGTTATTIAINKKVTTIDIANYSETANITISIGQFQAVIGNNIATTLSINANVENISLSATEADVKAQIIVKGVN